MSTPLPPLDLAGLTLPNGNALLRVCSPAHRDQVQAEIDRHTGTVRSAEMSPMGDSPEGGVGSGATQKGNRAGLDVEPARRENDVQREVGRIFIRRGAKVYWLSQKRRSGQTPGVPDLLVFDRYRGLVFIEAKTQSGRPSAEQTEFRELCLAAHVHHILGGLAEVRAFLGAEGEMSGTSHEPITESGSAMELMHRRDSHGASEAGNG
jgi:hypothetical protein